jgi:hypothetical protein
VFNPARRCTLAYLSLIALLTPHIAYGQWFKDGRQSLKDEIAGAWIIYPSGRAAYRYRYVEITTDGRIGWFVSEIKPAIASARDLKDAIDGKSNPGGSSRGWRPCKISDGEVVEKNEQGGPDLKYIVKTLTTPSDRDELPEWGQAVPGDLVMRQVFQTPVMTDPSRPAPEVLGPPPFYLHPLER